MHTTVRRVLPHEYAKYRTHLKSLDAESKILRFGYTVSDYVLDTLCDRFEANPSKHILFAIENDQLEFVAVGHIAIEEGMELAFSVLKDYQGQGMGNALIKRSIQWCRTHGIYQGTMICLSTNSVIKHLCSKYDIVMKNELGETLASIKLPYANALTYANELSDSNFAVVDYFKKRFTRPFAMLG
jgi:GNAT superfamily N-acetyltransferase